MKMMKQLFRDHTKNIIVCLIGAFVSAIAVNCFILESNLGDGGTVGISLALKYAFGWSPALSSLIINTLVIIVGWKFLRSEEHTSELQSRFDLVCRLLLEKKKQ